MCGICCILTPSTSDEHQKQLLEIYEKCNDSLCRRGPDSAEIKCASIFNWNILFFGTVLWLQGENIAIQPIETDKSWFLFNGDVFGDEVISSDVRHKFGDTVPLINEIEKSESIVETLSKIKGPFAFILLDKVKNILYFGRDTFGRRSLLIGKDGNKILLTSVATKNVDFLMMELPALGIYSTDLKNKHLKLKLTPWQSQNQNFYENFFNLQNFLGLLIKIKKKIKDDIDSPTDMSVDTMEDVLSDKKLDEETVKESTDVIFEIMQDILNNLESKNNDDIKMVQVNEASTNLVSDAKQDFYLTKLDEPHKLSDHNFDIRQNVEQSRLDGLEFNSKLDISKNESSKQSIQVKQDISHNLISLNEKTVAMEETSKLSTDQFFDEITQSKSVDQTYSDSTEDEEIESEEEQLESDYDELLYEVVESENGDVKLENKGESEIKDVELENEYEIKMKLNNEKSSLDILNNIVAVNREGFETVLSCDKWISNVYTLKALLEDAIERRIKNQPKFCKNCISEKLACNHALVGILFSGGVDCAILTLMADKFIDLDRPIDLLNVSFEKQNSFDSPDRITARQTLVELQKLRPNRIWNLLEINVTQEELNRERKERIADLIYPLDTILDESLGCALWFAARGKTDNYSSPCRVLLVGMGADELFGGYSRHRAAFSRGSWSELTEELDTDWKNISHRNLARDDRVISDHGRQVRTPYLDENFVEFVRKLNAWDKCYPLAKLQGIGDKLLLRCLAFHLGFKQAALLKKKALQFGSKIANSNENAHEKSPRLHC